MSLRRIATWRGTHDRDVTSAERSTVEAQELVTKLQERTKDTPYAFIGLAGVRYQFGAYRAVRAATSGRRLSRRAKIESRAFATRGNIWDVRGS